MYRPCDTGHCDPERCTDACSEEIGTKYTGYHVNSTATAVELYQFDENGKRVAYLIERIVRRGLPRGTREVWADTVLQRYGFK